jgi:hypothetical protein
VMRRTLLALLFMVTGLAGWGEPAAAAGPWRGQVVDAETGQPLEGVIVLSVWDKISPGLIHPRREYCDVDEVLTDANGHFVIPERAVLTANPFVSLDGPILHMFKPGYGPGLEQGMPQYSNMDDVRRLMQKQGVVFAMTQVTTREQRRETWPHVPSEIPDFKMRRFLEAINQERRSYGLGPIRELR